MIMNRLLPLSFSMVSGVLLLAACQGGTDDVALGQAQSPQAGAATGLEGAFPAQFDPCDLVSMEDAAEASGEAVREPESAISDFGVATCTFDPVDGLFPPVVLEVRPSDGAYNTALEVAEQMLAGQDQTIELLDDVGERAFYSVMLGHNIAMAAHGRFANLIVRENPEADNREAAIDLARRIAQRLQ